jgi:hypothetical protein
MVGVNAKSNACIQPITHRETPCRYCLLPAMPVHVGDGVMTLSCDRDFVHEVEGVQNDCKSLACTCLPNRRHRAIWQPRSLPITEPSCRDAVGDPSLLLVLCSDGTIVKTPW